jgi:hypothetical protein
MNRAERRASKSNKSKLHLKSTWRRKNNLGRQDK